MFVGGQEFLGFGANMNMFFFFRNLLCVFWWEGMGQRCAAHLSIIFILHDISWYCMTVYTWYYIHLLIIYRYHIHDTCLFWCQRKLPFQQPLEFSKLKTTKDSIFNILHGHFYHFIPHCKELILCLGFLSKRQGWRIVDDLRRVFPNCFLLLTQWKFLEPGFFKVNVHTFTSIHPWC